MHKIVKGFLCRRYILFVKDKSREVHLRRRDRAHRGTTEQRARLDDLRRVPVSHLVIVAPLNNLIAAGRVADIAALAVIEHYMTLRVAFVSVDNHVAFFKLIRVKGNDIIPRIFNKTVDVHNTIF